MLKDNLPSDPVGLVAFVLPKLSVECRIRWARSSAPKPVPDVEASYSPYAL